MASNNMSMRIVFDNSPMVIEETKKQVKKGLVSWGTIAEGYAKEDAAVNTGRMRNSITWAIKGQQSPPNTNKNSQGGADAAPDDYRTLSTPAEGEVYVGTNVEYAPGQELHDMVHRSGKAHFLRDAIAKHIDEYKAAMEAALKGE